MVKLLLVMRLKSKVRLVRITICSIGIKFLVVLVFFSGSVAKIVVSLIVLVYVNAHRVMCVNFE